MTSYCTREHAFIVDYGRFHDFHDFVVTPVTTGSTETHHLTSLTVQVGLEIDKSRSDAVIDAFKCPRVNGFRATAYHCNDDGGHRVLLLETASGARGRVVNDGLHLDDQLSYHMTRRSGDQAIK